MILAFVYGIKSVLFIFNVSSSAVCMQSLDHCIIVAVCSCITFQLAHVVIEKINALNIHGGSNMIHGHGASSLATSKGV